jgi:uncharacterized protein YdaT
MIKIKYVKALMLGICLSAISSGVALAGTLENRTADVTVQDSSTDSKLADLQSKVDQYVFTDHFEDFQKKGFTVTHTAPMEGYIEVGITPYSDKNAAYLYDALGKDEIKVVEGEEVMLYTTMDTAPDSVPAATVDAKALEKQDEVNKILFQDKINEIEKKDLAITSATAIGDAVEVGILPYTQENVDYIYSILGNDLVKVVEGKEPELMATSGIATDGVITDTSVNEVQDGAAGGNVDVVKVTGNTPVENTSNDKNDNILPIAGIAGVALLLGGMVYISQRKKMTR